LTTFAQATTPAAMNAAKPPPGVTLCRLDELADPGSKTFRIPSGKATFAGFIVLKDGEVSGFVDVCPHQGLPVAQKDGGYLTEDAANIRCMWHRALFSIRDGASVPAPGCGPLLAWPLQVVDGIVRTA
jgi:nitrite reductase/ring-hydroxylating ferredoxin subunit